ncbi:DUF2971 domain-containing protein [Cupriavidus sp. D39]|uniref:DUF2971 domain-containing protein n=1 Tax=Cupriavidus sp. D39 TaxID=2997877 RepID=UPI00226E5BFF|nr:DUF2971 domain-containing protein [Cupriavidus sp. D39]MCY0853234.1 DUF2971 domain-containing protein [Cupriavidus sp. D39]
MASAANILEGSFDVDKKIEEYLNVYLKVTNKNVGVLSLTESCCNELMWAHYGGSYAGYVVGFDSNSSFFKPKKGDPKVCGELMSVIYSDARPVVDIEPGKMEIPKEVFFTKSRKWEYEKEWRMLKYLGMADEGIPKENPSIHLFSVPPDAITEVIFGSKFDGTARGEIESKTKDYAPHVTFKEQFYDAKQDRILIR